MCVIFDKIITNIFVQSTQKQLIIKDRVILQQMKESPGFDSKDQQIPFWDDMQRH